MADEQAFKVGSKTYYLEDGKIYDEDGEHIGKAPNIAAAKKFIEENFDHSGKMKDMSKLAEDSEKFSDEVEKRMKRLATDDRGELEAEDMGTGTVDKSKVSPEGDKQLSAKRLGMDEDMRKLFGIVKTIRDLCQRTSIQCPQAIKFAKDFGEPELANDLNQLKIWLDSAVSKLDY